MEGPINDSWTELSLQRDARTDELLLVECRREWLGGGSANIRTYYTQPLTLTPGDEIAVSFGLPANDPLTKTLDDSSKPNYEPAKKRLRRYCHPEYPATSTSQDFILAKTKFRAYSPSCSSFVDLVNDPAPRPGTSRLLDRLRLRIASRTQKSPLIEDPEEPAHFLLRPQELDENDVPLNGSEDDFHPTDIHVWPPDDAPTELFDLLCPGGRTGQVDTVADDTSIVYITAPSSSIPNGERAVVLINFDPTWGRRGLKLLNLGSSSNRVNMRVERDSPCNSSSPMHKRHSAMEVHDDDDCSYSRKKQKGAASSSSSTSNQQPPQQPHGPRFMQEDCAMYLSINRGYRFMYT